MAKVTFSDAMRKIKEFLVGHAKEEEEKKDDNTLHCKRCGSPMSIRNQSHSDFITVFIYHCLNCHAMIERQIDVETNELRKEIFIANPLNDIHHSNLEIFNKIDFESFDLNRIWSIAGVLCYPVLIRTEFSDKTSLIFVRCTDNIRDGDVDGYIINEHRMIGTVHLMRNQEISYFCNPYLTSIPHISFGYISYPTEISDMVEFVSRIRYQHKKADKNGLRIHELTIFEDFPILTFGVEIYVKFVDYNYHEEPLAIIARKIHLTDHILRKTVEEINGDYSIQSVRMHQINLNSYITKHIKEEIRREFAEDIKTFLSYISTSAQIIKEGD